MKPIIVSVPLGGNTCIAPAEIDLGIYPELIKMENIIRNKLIGYQEDFYFFGIYYYFLFKRKVLWLVRETGTRIINLYNYENVEEKQAAFEILEFYIHQNCSVIYSIIDGRLKKVNYNQAFELLESVKVSKNLVC
ncbi:hypothetical protein [Bacillus luti]|uniref:hypothetical protein n=1 Tax=Bacillus luti TaxID=2026191 RepID=UPI003D06BF45